MVSSVIAAQSVQKDGRVWVTEQHVDSLGATYTITYLAHDASGVAAHLAADAVSLLKHQAGFRAEESESCGHDNLDDEGGCVECKASRDELRAEFDADMVCDMDQAEQDSA